MLLPSFQGSAVERMPHGSAVMKPTEDPFELTTTARNRTAEPCAIAFHGRAMERVKS